MPATGTRYKLALCSLILEPTAPQHKQNNLQTKTTVLSIHDEVKQSYYITQAGSATLGTGDSENVQEHVHAWQGCACAA